MRWMSATFYANRNLAVIFLLITAVKSIRVTFVSMQSYISLPYSLNYLEPAIDLALVEVKKFYSGQLTFSLRALNISRLKTCGDVLSEVLPFWNNFYFDRSRARAPNDVVVILSNPCSDSVGLLGDLAREYGITIITSGGSDSFLDSRIRFPTLLRLLPYQQLELAGVTGSLLVYFGWSDVTVICDDGATEMNTYSLVCRTLPPYLQRLEGMHSVNNVHYNFRTNPDHKRFLTEASRFCRIFVIITHGSRLRPLMIVAQQLGMAKGENVFIAYEPFKSTASFGKLTWNYGNEDDLIAKQAYGYLLIVTGIHPETNESEAIFNEMKMQSEKFYGSKYPEGEPVNAFVSTYYQGILLISQIISESLENIGNATLVNFAKAAWNRQFATPIGKVKLDENGDMENDFGVKSMVPDSDRYDVIFVWNKKTKMISSFDGRKVIWPNNQTTPLNKPFCGFMGIDKKCDIKPTDIRNTVLGLVGVVVTVTALTVGCISWQRRRQLLNDMTWIIPAAEIRTTSASSKSIANMRSTISLHGNAAKSPQRSTYRGIIVWIRRVDNFEQSKMTASVVAAISSRVHFRSNHVATFIGMYFDNSCACITCEYFAKGSLDDFIFDKELSIDRTLQLSILSDIAKGILSVHQSSIKFHGSLKSSNCMITSQLAVKVTDFGLETIEKNRVAKCFEGQLYGKLLWTAPEVLRNPLHAATRESDLYSFGIVMYEIMFLTWPYRLPDDQQNLKNMDDEEIIMAVIATSSPPFRPRLVSDHSSNDFHSLMADCWNENPNQRRSMPDVIKVLDELMGGKNGFSYMDSIIYRLKSYAEDLESQVGERTQELMSEKQKSEELLRNMLPAVVADALIRGLFVDAETFDNATLAFTGVWNFAEIANVGSALDIVALLNDLYMCMDALLPEFDVYKVETVKDSYLLASGVPRRNANAHASEVGSLCCTIMRTVEKQNFAQMSIQLYIGIHTGPLAAGIIGHKMMRYCLFGDTVNVASRMLSTAEASKIQISASTYKLLQTSTLTTFSFQPRGEIIVKGKGVMSTFWLHQLPESMTGLVW